MSSDVYIDFGAGSPAAREPRRIGHLGTMNYFGYELLDALRVLREASGGIVTPWLLDAATNVSITF